MRSSWSKVGPNPSDWCPSKDRKRAAERDGDMSWEGRGWRMSTGRGTPRAASQQLLGATRQDSSPSLGGRMTLGHLDFSLSAYGTETTPFCG